MDPHAAQWVPISIAVGTVIVVPTAVWFGKKIASAWHRHRVEMLSEVFATKQDVDRKFDVLTETQQRQHGENTRALETLRMEAKEREGKLTAMLTDTRADVRDEARAMASSVGEVHKRVDSILHMLGNRRKP